MPVQQLRCSCCHPQQFLNSSHRPCQSPVNSNRRNGWFLIGGCCPDSQRLTRPVQVVRGGGGVDGLSGFLFQRGERKRSSSPARFFLRVGKGRRIDGVAMECRFHDLVPFTLPLTTLSQRGLTPILECTSTCATHSFSKRKNNWNTA